MSRPRGIPSYRRHKQSGQAVVTLTDPSGRRRDVYLGPYGTAASRQEYARVLAEWEANGRRLSVTNADDSTHGLSVNELILTNWAHVENYYRYPDGAPTSEVDASRRRGRTGRGLLETGRIRGTVRAHSPRRWLCNNSSKPLPPSLRAIQTSARSMPTAVA